ncbi:transporter [Thiosulfatimonas sediminis]|uniref:Transporter n=1 Tax=Thiosulfatimonas sediminis TaxID=2675054 RepID=A0A6F8PUN4_9GAMM|nr:sodium-dependent transporter [Thiosulfatimonas sediminis]BBP45841.1 transporter [Thiosulfatimonas sediminis]
MQQGKVSPVSWSSQTVFILAAIGSAVGLGNIWKFPYITGENGGGAFVLVYLAAIVLIGLPILLAELILGRSAKANPVQGMGYLAAQFKASRWWWLLGLNGVLAGALILSFYTVIAGWAVAYFVSSAQGAFINISSSEVGAHFDKLLLNPWELLLWHTIFSLVTIFIVARGIRSGIEKAISWMMPGLFLILLVLLGYATTTGAFGQSFHFLFNPDFAKLSWQGVLVAIGHAFFTLSIGMSAMMVYGSYLDEKASLVKAAIWIAIADTVIAIMAALVIFSIVFANSLEPAVGPGLLFQTLPVAFGQMWGGWLFGTLFFALVIIAALSSAISLIEPALSWLEQRWQIRRAPAAWALGGLIWLIGIASVLSFNHWKSFSLLGDRNIFDTLDFITTNIMLPLGGLMMSLFVAWVMDKETRRSQLNLNSTFERALVFDLKWIAPVAIALVFAVNLLSAPTSYLLVFGFVLLYGVYIWISHYPKD